MLVRFEASDCRPYKQPSVGGARLGGAPVGLPVRIRLSRPKRFAEARRAVVSHSRVFKLY